MCQKTLSNIPLLTQTRLKNSKIPKNFLTHSNPNYKHTTAPFFSISKIVYTRNYDKEISKNKIRKNFQK